MSTPNDTSDTITIQLTQGYSTIIDAIDADLAALKWWVRFGHRSDSKYATHTSKSKKKVQLHRLILSRVLGRDLLPTEYVDHIDGDGLNNCRSNLRLATLSQNNINSRGNRRNKSGYRGVSFNRNCKLWVAFLGIGGKQVNLGYFKTPEEAYEAYKRKAKEVYGDFFKD